VHTADQLNAALSERYAIDRQIGAGGMATVFLARDLKHNRQVALKVLNPELGAVLGFERFMAEIEVTANLHHPNLLPLFDSGEANSLLFYAMPFIEGETLRATPSFTRTSTAWRTSPVRTPIKRGAGCCTCCVAS
jgi:serine/threonine-protein kinase